MIYFLLSVSKVIVCDLGTCLSMVFIQLILNWSDLSLRFHLLGVIPALTTTKLKMKDAFQKGWRRLVFARKNNVIGYTYFFWYPKRIQRSFLINLYYLWYHYRGKYIKFMYLLWCSSSNINISALFYFFPQWEACRAWNSIDAVCSLRVSKVRF